MPASLVTDLLSMHCEVEKYKAEELEKSVNKSSNSASSSINKFR